MARLSFRWTLVRPYYGLHSTLDKELVQFTLQEPTFEGKSFSKSKKLNEGIKESSQFLYQRIKVLTKASETSLKWNLPTVLCGTVGIFCILERGSLRGEFYVVGSRASKNRLWKDYHTASHKSFELFTVF